MVSHFAGPVPTVRRRVCLWQTRSGPPRLPPDRNSGRSRPGSPSTQARIGCGGSAGQGDTDDQTTTSDLTSASGIPLAGWLDLPDGDPTTIALFAHCFTCGKDSHAATRISRGLTSRGIGVIRFDFTGLGESAGEFADTTFGSSIEDLVAAADYLRTGWGGPHLLIGHSLGGAAVLAAAERIPEVTAVVTIGAPSDPAHIAHLLAGTAPQIQAHGEADVRIGGRTFRVGRGFMHDIGEQPQAHRITHLGAALMVLHSPQDTIVGVDNAGRIYQAARHPKSFISLDGADHLLTDPADAAYAAEVIAAWAARYLPKDPAIMAQPALTGPVTGDSIPDGTVDVSWAAGGRYRQAVRTSTHDWVVDEPVSVGGNDSGPNPYDQLLAALGTCTAITLRMYADRKGWPLQHVSVRLRHDRVHAKDCGDCTTSSGTLTRIRRGIRLDGPLTDDQRDALMAIADRCPVHQVLRSETVIDTLAVEPHTDPTPA